MIKNIYCPICNSNVDITKWNIDSYPRIKDEETIEVITTIKCPRCNNEIGGNISTVLVSELK